jgi:dual specificity protein kinase YAK1
MYMLEMGKNSPKFFERRVGADSKVTFRLKDREQYSREYKVDEKPSKRYFEGSTLRELVFQVPSKKKLSEKETIEGMLIDFGRK